MITDPIAGTEQSGPESGFAELFDNRWCILTPPTGCDPAAVSQLKVFWEKLGSFVQTMSPEHHDLVLAITSHAIQIQAQQVRFHQFEIFCRAVDAAVPMMLVVDDPNMIGVIVHDNFNLKDENRKLRERMLEMERALAEYQRREETRKERMENRLRALEGTVGALQQQVAQLVQLYRQQRKPRRGWFW